MTLTRVCYVLLVLVGLAGCALVFVRIQTSAGHVVRAKLPRIQENMTTEEVAELMRGFGCKVQELTQCRIEVWQVGEAHKIQVEYRRDTDGVYRVVEVIGSGEGKIIDWR